MNKPKVKSIFRTNFPRDWRNSDKKYFSSNQIAYISGLSPSSIFRAIKEGQIPSARTPGGHFRVEEKHVMRFVKDMGITPGQHVMNLVHRL